jgi:hypothetical protein
MRRHIVDMSPTPAMFVDSVGTTRWRGIPFQKMAIVEIENVI